MRLLPLIEDILENNPRTRDSDKELFIQVMQRRGMELTYRQIDIMRDLNFESIRRTRQKLQEQGKYRASDRVAKQRRIKSYVMQQNAPIAKPERIEKLTQQAISWREE